ncbi:hypothetical protein GCM10011374_34350 [Kocuria dechangensis]|uniref:Uncharacterized protein n=1 Tax=Kocuria dechangensis TaxID=1176249 RepID=A0A917H4D8_9MICC|nr:hypothetical protein [Kocuria dechangensis]GGG67262.1 hypothetical protein GCM10011374_34350 [Kocuria dechangensis]
MEVTQLSPACPQVDSPFLTAVLGDALAWLARDKHCQRLSATMPGDLTLEENLPVTV